MATQDVPRDQRCPACGGRIENKPPSGGLLATVVFGDMLVFTLAGLVAVAGVFWSIAWVVALCLVALAIVRMVMRKPLYCCVECKREFSHRALYAAR